MNPSISAAAQYSGVRLPERPRLAPWVRLVDLGDDRLQLRHASGAFTLRHRFFIEILERIRPLLDGQHSVEELANAGGQEILPTTVIFLLQALAANGLLQEARAPDSLAAADLAAFDREIQFLAHFTSQPLTTLATLRKARVGVAGSPRLVAEIRSGLTALGVGQVSELRFPEPAKEGVNPSHQGEASGSDPMDFLIACQESPGFAFFQAVNDACLASGMRWMRIAVEGTTAHLGPTILPHQTACYTCYERRASSLLADPGSFAAFREQESHTDRPPDEGAFAPFWSVIAGQAALEAARILTGFLPPATFGRFYEFGVGNPTTTGHEVLRLPRCPSCRPPRPPTQVWEWEIPETGLQI